MAQQPLAKRRIDPYLGGLNKVEDQVSKPHQFKGEQGKKGIFPFTTQKVTIQNEKLSQEQGLRCGKRTEEEEKDANAVVNLHSKKRSRFGKGGETLKEGQGQRTFTSALD